MAIAQVVTLALAMLIYPRQAGLQERSDCAVVADALKDVAAIKIGSKRSDLARHWQLGSYTFREKTTYVYKGCRYIHIDVDFRDDPNVPNEYTADWPPSDTVKSVSKPYLDYPSTD